MPAERFFVDADLIDSVSVEGTEFHHLVHVMRVRLGDEVELVNGRGALANAKVASFSKHSANLQILSVDQTPLSLPKVILAIPLMRPSKLELIIEKGTELGADAFYLYPADHSEKDDLSENQLERLHHIAISAMKQCGRLDLPQIQLFKRLQDLFTLPGTFLFGDTRTDAKKISYSAPPAVFITGPERGFSEKELKILNEKALGVRLHKNILRAETAPLAACIMLMVII